MSGTTKAGSRKATPIIAIGASAGGLEACRALLNGLPDDIDAALVLILHLDPSHESMMVDLLARDTKLKVVLASDGMTLRPGHLYVIPPGVFLTVNRGVLHTAAPQSGTSVRLPFDALLQSLAKDAAQRIACVILSGTGTDGSGGLAAINAAGGVIIAQEPAEATYAGMPEKAVATGLVDHVLKIADMPAILGQVMSGSLRQTDRSHATKDDAKKADADTKDTAGNQIVAPENQNFDAIIDLVAQAAPQDVSLYKTGTIQRRIARRMAIADCGQADIDRYMTILRTDKDELAKLSADLLIHVTSFFRDPAVFAHLSEVALPALIAAQPGDRPLRLWVAGCSTGEEAYSLAIVCLEAMEDAGFTAGLQVFASDIDPDAIATAREGFYPTDIKKDISPARLSRFFNADDHGWRVRSDLRDVIVFTVADLLTDPPFSRIDLVSCRNVLIYLEAEAQRRVIGLCGFALRQGGLLLLGTAETPGAGDNQFEVEDKGARLWRCVNNNRPLALMGNTGMRTTKKFEQPAPTNRRTALADLCRGIILDCYAPAAVLLSTRLECLYMLGPIERYLSVTQGHPDPGFLGMLPKTLHARFRAAAASCDHENPFVVVPGGYSAREGKFNIELRAVRGNAAPLLLACFVNVPRTADAQRPEDAAQGDDAGRITTLESDLETTRRDLRDALRDLEQEVDMHAADTAEAMSVNEEFQSTNEELLASKEELQALNEELTALNSQLQETLERHRTTANDLQNVLYSTDVATLFLDIDLNIRFFTPMARAVFRVIATDVGRPLADLAPLSKDEKLTADAHTVLETTIPIEREIAGPKGVWYLRRVQPYRTDGRQVEGVVITFVDITERKHSHAALSSAKRQADRANVAKSRFLAAASHDLRQPLQSLAVLHGLMARGKRTAEAVRLSSLLDRTLNSMSEMLDSLLDVNRIDSGTVRPEPQRIAISPILEWLAEEFAPLCDLKGLKLRVVPTKAWVRTDPKLLEQILRNLLSNALKYTAEGGILIGCRKKGTRLTLMVCDTGVGIAETERKAIFEAYHRVEKPSIAPVQGLGLGLSIVQRLAILLDHPLAVRSTPDKGSSFMITLPVVAPEEESATTAIDSKSGRSPITGTILLVEDQDDLRHLLAEMLQNAGHLVIPMANGQDALSWATDAAESPDLLLTDFDLEGSISGLALAQRLSHFFGHSIPTLILTGDITIATLQDIAATPFVQIAKPVLPEKLLAQISKTLQADDTAAAHPPAGRATSDQPVLHVVDDDPMIRATMRRLFEAEGWVVFVYKSAEDFLSTPRPGAGACLVVDAVLPGMSGVALLEVLRAEQSTLPTIMLTGHGDVAMAVSAMKAGASDMMEKPASASEILASISHAMNRSTDDRARKSARRVAQKSFANLTPRERDILAKVLDGMPNKNIAADLGINQRTVENHRASVMRKTGASSLPELVRLALAAGPTVA